MFAELLNEQGYFVNDAKNTSSPFVMYNKVIGYLSVCFMICISLLYLYSVFAMFKQSVLDLQSYMFDCARSSVAPQVPSRLSLKQQCRTPVGEAEMQKTSASDHGTFAMSTMFGGKLNMLHHKLDEAGKTKANSAKNKQGKLH